MMVDKRSETKAADWRLRKKAETRDRLRACAMRLFQARGYEATTIEEIATAAGVSHMTFFRYFQTKEDVVLAGDYKPMIADLIADQPSDERPVDMIRHALVRGLAALSATERADLLARTRLVLVTPALQARQCQRQHADQQLIVQALARHPGHDEHALQRRVLAAACQAAAAAAVFVWAEDGGTAELTDLVSQAFDALRGA